MKFAVSVNYLDPIELGRNEWVSVRLPDGRTVTVYGHEVRVQTEQEVRSHKDGTRVWTGSYAIRNWPHGRTYEQHRAGNEPEEELPDPRVKLAVACRICVYRERGPHGRTWDRMVAHARQTGHILEWEEPGGPIGQTVITRADKLADNAKVSRLLLVQAEEQRARLTGNTGGDPDRQAGGGKDEDD